MNWAAKSSLNDAELVSLHKSGDDEAFEILALRHIGKLGSVVCAALYRYAGRASAERKERMVYEALMKAGLNIEKCSRPELFAHWLFRIASNAVVDDCRRLGRSREVACSELCVREGDGNQYNQCPDPKYSRHGVLDIIGEAEEAERLVPFIRKILDSLPARQGRILTMRICDGLSNKDIAREVGVNERTVSSHLAQGRRALREIIVRLKPNEMQGSTGGHTRRSYRAVERGGAGSSSSLPRMQGFSARGRKTTTNNTDIS